MSFFDDLTTLDQIGAETLAEFERRACVPVAVLLDAIRRDRVRYPPSDSDHMSHSLVCNSPGVEATGELKKHEETKAYKMLVMIAEFRDGPPEAKFSLRHAYTSAGVMRDTMQSWRNIHKLFDSIMTSIQEEMVDTMRAEAYRRSVVGYEEPVFYQGIKTDTVRKFSDGLLQFTLMGYDAKFRAKDVNMNVSGQLDSNINIEGLRDRLAQRLQQKSKAEE
jgi:predicted small metal-binding protein